MKRRIILISLIFYGFFGVNILFSQQTVTEKDLLARTEKLQDLLRVDPEKMFDENSKIIWETQRLGYKEVELMAVLNQYKYYRHKVDFDNMIITSKHLLSKANSYESPIFEAVARLNLFEAYAFLNLKNEAYEELKLADQILQKQKFDDSLTINTKMYLYNAYSNYYSITGNHPKRRIYIKQSMSESEKFKTEEHKNKLRYINYVNLAAAYIDAQKTDSAEYYCKLALEKDIYDFKDVKLLNYSTLSKIEIAKKNYQQALLYLKEVETLNGYRNHINDLEFYTTILDVYKQLGDAENTKKYRTKKDSLDLLIKENQNQSLHNMLDEEKKEKFSPNFYVYTLIFIVGLVIGLFFIIRKRKKKLLEKDNLPFVKGEELIERMSEEYSKLLEMFKKNDPAFMIYFEEVFPDFVPKLMKTNSGLIRSDIEFCALLKLKIPTHDIAQYKNITTKSVQNKKYYIRKKFNIPSGVDIYNWFSII